MALGGDVADSLALRERRLTGLLGSAFDYVGFTDSMLELEADRRRIVQAFSKIEKP